MDVLHTAQSSIVCHITSGQYFLSDFASGAHNWQVDVGPSRSEIDLSGPYFLFSVCVFYLFHFFLFNSIPPFPFSVLPSLWCVVIISGTRSSEGALPEPGRGGAVLPLRCAAWRVRRTSAAERGGRASRHGRLFHVNIVWYSGLWQTLDIPVSCVCG
jgi:hypothetical protein